MSDINCVTLTGRLTRDAELKYTQNGGAIVRFSMAVNRSKRNADGSWAEEASYFDCVYFGKGAESVNSYLSRGRQVAVSGELRQSRWEQDGQTRSRVEVFVNRVVQNLKMEMVVQLIRSLQLHIERTRTVIQSLRTSIASSLSINRLLYSRMVQRNFRTTIFRSN